MSGFEFGSQPIEPKLVSVVCSSKKEPRLAVCPSEEPKSTRTSMIFLDITMVLDFREHFRVHVWEMQE
jgi:hypothetical protein